MNTKRCAMLSVAAIYPLLASAGAGFAVVGRHDVSDERLVSLGKEFSATGRVIPDGSCTLIAPQWAITAAHVARSIRPGTGRVAFLGREYVVKRVVMHPKGKSRRQGPGGVDLALIEFKEDVADVTPTPLYRETDEEGGTAYIAGFGDIGDGKKRPVRSDGRCRAVTNVIHEVDADHIFMKFDPPPGGTELEGVGGPGDSGGPAYVRQDGKAYLVGVSHASMGGKPGRYGTTDIYMRVSSQLDWIDKTAGTSAGDTKKTPE